MKKLHCQLLLLFSLASISNSAMESNAIAQQQLSFSPPQQSSPPTHIAAAQRADKSLYKHNKEYTQQPTHPTKSQLNTVLSWMNRLYPSVSPEPTIIHAPKKTVQRYTLSSAVNDYCNAYDIDTKNLRSCNGDEQQHAIHAEFVAITTQSAEVWQRAQYTPALEQFPSMLADFTDAGLTFNHQGNAHKATTLASACWAILDCAHAIGEGVVQGVAATIDDIIHPIRTVQNIVESVATCGYYLGKVALEIGEFNHLVYTNQTDEALNKTNAWASNVITVYEAIQKKYASLTPRDAIKETVAFGTQCYATNKVLRGLGTLFKHAHKEAVKIIQEASHTANAPALTTPEGIVFRIADSTVECMKATEPLATHGILRVNNMKEFFELPFGKICFEHSQKTPYIYQNSIYKITKNIPGTSLKKGHYYYLDRLHGDHLEIFNRAYESVGVYNLDGTFNTIKYEAARGRTIRDKIKGK